MFLAIALNVVGGFAFRWLDARMGEFGLWRKKRSARARIELRFEPAAIARLRLHAWPGNVRELKHVTERLALICETALVTAHDVSTAIGGYEADVTLSSARHFERERLLGLLSRDHWNTALVAEENRREQNDGLPTNVTPGDYPPRFVWKASMAEKRRAAPGTT